MDTPSRKLLGTTFHATRASKAVEKEILSGSDGVCSHEDGEHNDNNDSKSKPHIEKRGWHPHEQSPLKRQASSSPLLRSSAQREAAAQEGGDKNNNNGNNNKSNSNNKNNSNNNNNLGGPRSIMGRRNAALSTRSTGRSTSVAVLQKSVLRQIGQQRLSKREQLILRVEYATCVFAVLGFIIAVIENELSYVRVGYLMDASDAESAPQYGYVSLVDMLGNTEFALKAIILVLSLMLCCGVCVHHYLLHRLVSSAAHAQVRDPASQTVLLDVPRKLLPVEIAICIFCIPPGVQHSIQVYFLGLHQTYRLEAFAVLWMFMRLYILLRTWRDSQAVRLKKVLPVLQQSGVTLSTQFIVKRTLDEKPLHIFVSVALFLLLGMAYAVRIGERDADPDQQYFWTNMWLIITTITTVGFGDTYPHTHIGRAFCGLSMVISMVFVSLMTASLSKAIGYTGVEQRVAHLVNKQEWREDLLVAAATLIKLWWRDKLRPGSVNPRHFSVHRDLWLKASRRYTRALQSEATVEKGLDGVIDKVQSLGKVSESQTMLVGRMEESVKQVNRILESRFSSLEGKVSCLRCAMSDMRSELSSLHELQRDVNKLTCVLTQKAENRRHRRESG